ncbi:ribosomal protein S18-alanine N-acetyltransferase [bacterium]|nr:ribosomal protein S18-alanine N-acetyltransferase [bacterium]
MTKTKQKSEIRELTAKDIPHIAEAEVKCFPEDAWDESAIRESVLHPLSYSLVQMNNNVLSGYLISFVYAGEAHLFNIAILPKFRQRGYASELLSHWMNIITVMDARVVYLEVRHSNQAAISLYEKFGFRTVGVRTKYYSNGEDAILMTCDIPQDDDME